MMGVLISTHELTKASIEIRQSNIHNRGVFATKYIRKGETIEIVPLISDVSLNNIRKSKLKDYVITTPSRFLHDNIDVDDTKCSVMLGFGSLYNHSDDNNAGWNFIDKNTMIIKAVKDINPNEEICVTYGDEYWNKRTKN
jgi:SET domain-containing protein